MGRAGEPTKNWARQALSPAGQGANTGGSCLGEQTGSHGEVASGGLWLSLDF